MLILGNFPYCGTAIRRLGKSLFRGMNETSAMSWWKEVRERLEHTARNFPGGFEQQTVFNLLADLDALQLVCEPYSDLEPRLAVYQALRKLFIG
jgi:ABC-type phosphate transport system ATPase subunit